MKNIKWVGKIIGQNLLLLNSVYSIYRQNSPSYRQNTNKLWQKENNFKWSLIILHNKWGNMRKCIMLCWWEKCKASLNNWNKSRRNYNNWCRMLLSNLMRLRMSRPESRSQLSKTINLLKVLNSQFIMLQKHFMTLSECMRLNWCSFKYLQSSLDFNPYPH